MHESITIFNDLCKSIETHIYARKKHPLTNYLAKHQKHSKFAVTDIREKPVDSFKDSARASVFAPAIILLTWVSLQNPLRKLLQRSPSQQNYCGSRIDARAVSLKKFTGSIILQYQGIINMNRNGNTANFFSYVCNDKKIKSCLSLL